jgi:ABC-2 type transport system permease protein
MSDGKAGTINLGWTPFLTLIHKEIMRFVKVIGQTVLTPIVNSTLYLLIFGVSLGGSITMASGVKYLAFLIPGLVMMAALNNAYQNSASSVITSKFHGDLTDLRIMPLTGQEIVWAMSIGGLIRGLCVGAMTYLVSQVFYLVTQGELLHFQNWPLFLLFTTVGSLCFAMLGIAVGFNASSFDKVNAISSFVLVPLLYLGGVFYSVDTLHPFWRAISRVNPLLYFINGVRFSTIGVSDVSVEMALAISFLSLIVMFAIATRCVKNGSYSRW